MSLTQDKSQKHHSKIWEKKALVFQKSVVASRGNGQDESPAGIILL